MSEKMLRVPLGDLKTVRVKCKGMIKQQDKPDLPCPMIYEIEIEKLSQAFPSSNCVRCSQPFWTKANAGSDPLGGMTKSCG